MRPGYILTLFGWILVTALVRADDSSIYGKSDTGEAALMGIFYDLKQTQTHVPAEASKYPQVIDEFLTKNWDESVLNRYYRASRPIYTTQIFIPQINADQGPKAFGVEKLVVPNWYLVHYKGQVEVPETGTYRFVGYGDNVMCVGVNEKTVLVANRADVILPTFKWTSTGTGERAYPDADAINGTWLPLKKDDIIDLDVLIGESSGGLSAFYLMIEKQGEHYALDEKGHPILPIFQVAPYDTPVSPPQSWEPKFAKSGVVWKCLQ